VVMGMLVGLLAFRSLLTTVLLGLVYLAVAIPAALDASQVARGLVRPGQGQAAWSVILMLLAVGPFAIPLLWQSPWFSRTAKIGWTVAISVVAVLGIVATAALGPLLTQILQGSSFPP